MYQILLAAAHKHQSPLPSLVAELRDIERALLPLQQQRRIQLLSIRAADLEDIFNTFILNKNVQIFHYAGHADEENLYLEEAGKIKGIAELFGLQREPSSWNKLRLVFLNGCATQGHVADLHAAGVAAVLATSRNIDDDLAATFAKIFYQTWMAEDKTLKEAFEIAKAWVHTQVGYMAFDSQRRQIAFRSAADYKKAISWGVYLHPDLASSTVIENWVLNERPKLAPMLLATVQPNATQSLRALVHEFIKTDIDAREQVRHQRKNPLMVLIGRLPWTIGTHLRRLFAIDTDQTMLQPNRERLKELTIAYSDLSRFISYLCLSMLWDSRRKQRNLKPDEPFEPLPFTIVPAADAFHTTDYFFRTKVYYERLLQLREVLVDPISLLPRIGSFLEKLKREEGLGQAYLVMEGWKQAVLAGDSQLDALIQSRSAGQTDGLKSLVLEAEAIYAQFLKAALFLTQYKLHTVRSIMVNKLHNLEDECPYSHYTISLHAAFSQLQTLMTERETASDNYCLMLTYRQQGKDLLAKAINLSPFYLDRSSYIGNNTRNYPAIFMLNDREGEGSEARYRFQYIDTDVNYQYTFQKDHKLLIDQYGAQLPNHLEVDHESIKRFERIHEQLRQLDQDIPQHNPKAL